MFSTFTRKGYNENINFFQCISALHTDHNMVDAEKAVSRVFDLLQNYGHNNYVGERVTCLQHSLQCASCAEKDGASNAVSSESTNIFRRPQYKHNKSNFLLIMAIPI